MSGSLVILRSAKQLLTLHGTNGLRRGPALREIGLVQDGALLIRDGIVIDAGPTRRIENLAPARDAEVIEARGRIVMPVFHDSGLQLLSPPVADEQDSLLAGGDAQEEEAGRWERYLSTTSVHRLEASAALMLERLCRHGTGSAELVVGAALSSTFTLKALRVNAALTTGRIPMSSTLVADRLASRVPAQILADFHQLVAEVVPSAHRRGSASCVALQVGGNGYSQIQNWQLSQLARSNKLKIAVFSSTGSESEALQFSNDTGARSITGLTQLNEQQQRILGILPSAAILTSGAVLEKGFARRLADAGAAVALSTGFSAAKPGSYSMQEMIFEACFSGGLSLREAVCAATINAAHAIGIGAHDGSLEPGKQANFLILNTPDYRDLQTRRGVNLVHAMYQRGKLVYREGDVSRE